MSKTNTVFGTASKTIVAWSKTTSTSFGISQQAALEATSSIGNMFIQMGEGADRAATLSIEMVQLAADLASFHNAAGGTVGVLQDMQSAFRGEFDPIQKYIPLINAATVEQVAMSQSGKEATKQLTALDKALAVQTLILRGAGVAAGDFARTIGGIANQERILAARREDALARIGQAFAPIYLTILQGINSVIDQVLPYGEGIVRSLATGMVRGIIWLLPVIRNIRDFFIEWLRPSSPPKILPDLAKWGTEAMQVYLNAWSQADFGVLQNLGGAIESILRSFVTSGKLAESEIVSRVFGTRQAITNAVNEWRRAGHITEGSINAIQQAAGEAGFGIAGLVRSYFDLEGASRRAAAAQEELSNVTEHYQRLLDPLQGQLDEINDKQQAIRDRQQISQARRTLRDPAATLNEKRLAQLEIEEIGVRQQMKAVEDERDVALEAAEKKLKAAQREERVARAIYDAQQALLDQAVKTNQLIGEENELRRKQQEEANRLYEATLQYNLALADTEGKIALMRLELQRHEKGSIGYFNILTQIAGLEKQLASERAAEGPLIAAEDILPEPGEIDIPKWAKDLSTELKKAINEVFGIEEPLIGPIPNPLTSTTIKGGSPITANIAPPEVSEQVKDFVATIKDLTEALQHLEQPLTFLATLFGFVPTQSELAAAETKTALDDIVLAAENAGKGIKSAGDKEWRPAFASLRDLVGQGLLVIANMLPTPEGQEAPDTSSPIHGLQKMGQGFSALMLAGMILGQGPLVINYLNFLQWLRDQLPGSEPADPSSPLFGLQDAGSALLDNIWDGLKLKWEELSTWWLEKMQWLRDMLPFSEPKNANSPLAGLPEAGKAIISQIQLGIDEVDLSIGTPKFGPPPTAGATSTTRTLNFQPGSVIFNGVAGGADAADRFKESMREWLESMA